MGRREKRSKNRGSAGNNRKSGEDFLVQNLQKEGIVETKSGLQYLVVDEKEGEKQYKQNPIFLPQIVSWGSLAARMDEATLSPWVDCNSTKTPNIPFLRFSSDSGRLSETSR